MEKTREQPALSRREARRNDRREAILAVANRSFLEHGYAATSMSAIAATVGGSKATLWSYFPSKAALFEAVVDEATLAFRQRLSLLLDPEGDPEETLRNFCADFVERVTAPQAVALYRLALSEACRFPEIGEIFYQRGPRSTHALLGAFIASAIERRRLRRTDPVEAAKVLTLLCMGGCHQQLLLGRIDVPTPELIRADADAALDIFMRAFAI